MFTVEILKKIEETINQNVREEDKVTYSGCDESIDNDGVSIYSTCKYSDSDFLTESGHDDLNKEFCFVHHYFKNAKGIRDNKFEKENFTILANELINMFKKSGFKQVNKKISTVFGKKIQVMFSNKEGNIYILVMNHSKSSYGSWEDMYVTLYENVEPEIKISTYQKNKVLEVFNSCTPLQKENFKKEVLSWLV